jgi:hypothetical protein
LASVYLRLEETTDRILLEDESGLLLLEIIETEFNRRIRYENQKRQLTPQAIHIRAYAEPQ